MMKWFWKWLEGKPVPQYLSGKGKKDPRISLPVSN